MRSSVCIVILLSLVGVTARAQTPVALECENSAACVALYEQAAQQSKAGQLMEAEKSYRLAYEVSHDARLLFSIGRVLDKRGQDADAKSYYRQFLQSGIEDESQKAKARELLAALETKQTPPLATNPSLAVTSKTEGMDKPVYRKGWFWGVVAGSVAAVGLGIGLGVGLSSRGPMVPSGANVFEPTVP